MVEQNSENHKPAMCFYKLLLFLFLLKDVVFIKDGQKTGITDLIHFNNGFHQYGDVPLFRQSRLHHG